MAFRFRKSVKLPSDASGTTWRLASARAVGDARIDLQVTPDGRIASVGIAGDPSGSLAALVLEDLHVPEADRLALTWHVREHVSALPIDDAKPLCGAGICVVAGLEPGGPTTRLRLDPTIDADRRALERSARAAARAAERASKVDAHQRAKGRPSTHRDQPRTRKAEPQRQLKEASTPSPMRSCCKYCSSGIPCGDTCIAANRTCRRGPGCAC